MAGGFVDSLQAKVQEVAKEDFGKARGLADDAMRSQSYLYPFRGIFYFMSHRALWKPLTSRLAPSVALYVGVLTSLLFFTYLPQLAVMTLVNGPLAVFTTLVLILEESATIVSVLSRNFLLQDAILDTFDGTLVSKGATDIVTEGRQLKSNGDPIQRLGRILKTPFKRFSPSSIVRYLLYLPLNFIPVIGTVVFITLQGRSHGNSVHDRYFQLKKWSASQKKAWLDKHTGPYTAFGLVAILLELVPFASIGFSFTNAVGAALWAADIEAKENQMARSTAPGLQYAAQKAE